jgi:hypothetical protein
MIIRRLTATLCAVFASTLISIAAFASTDSYELSTPGVV